MAFLKFLYRNGLWISPLVLGISATMLVLFILSVSRLGERDHLLTVPLLEEQEVEFAGAGPVVLCVQGPLSVGRLMTVRFTGLAYELRTANNAPVKSRRSWFHAKSSGFSTTRVEIRSFEIPEPGRYLLRVQCLKAGQAADPRYRIVFIRPHLAEMLGYILGIVLTGVLTIASLVLAILRVALKGRGA